MEILRVDPEAPDADAIARAAALLREGRLVAFPTETVYGLGANALDPAAVDRIYAAKGRPAYNPLIVHVADVEQARRVVAPWPDRAQQLAEHFWPGPLTLVLPKRSEIPDGVTAGLPSVAVRVPSHPVALALLRQARIPVAAPSANRSMMLSPTTAAHVARSLGDAVDLILDGGPTTVGIESTVVDLGSAAPRVLRPGMIGAAELSRVVGPVDVAQPGETDRLETTPRLSPGTLGRHYSPRARLVIADREQLNETVEREARAGRRVGALLVSQQVETAIRAGSGDFSERVIRLPATAAGYAGGLYASLHALDDAGVDVIVVEAVPAGAAWDGVRDRLRRAAQPDDQPATRSPGRP